MQALKQRHQQAIQETGPPGTTPIGPPGSAALPAQPSIAPSAVPFHGMPGAGIEPPNKRQKTAPDAIMPVPSQPAYQVQQMQPVQAAPGQAMAPQQPLSQPSSRPKMPNHPPGTAPGYVYSQPGVPQAPGTAMGAPTVKSPNSIAVAPGVAFSNGQVITPKFTGPKPQEDHTLINCFSIEEIETHVASLNKGLQLAPQKLKTKCLETLKILQGHQHGWVFNSPVDPVELGLPDYFEVIKKPMDLGTIRKKLENGCYHTLEEFEGHGHLTFDNAMAYNPEGSVVWNMAKEMKVKFAEDFKILMKQLNAEEDAKRKNGEACLLCGCEKLLFEPPVFYCNGFNCPSKRIRRNSYYYVGGNNQYHWCHQCFQELKDNKTIELGDITIQKGQLTKKKNDEVHEESWVQCDRCERWVHQICALFNTRQNKDQRSEYACPRCTIDERRKAGRTEGSSSTPMAEDLQRTKLSEYLENNVRIKMEENLEPAAAAKAAADVSIYHHVQHLSFLIIYAVY
jgi:E1A/CREB-binding protein